MATTKKNAPVSRKKSLKSYRQNYKEPLPDFLKAIGTEEGEVSAPPAAARPSAQPRGQVAMPISSIQTQQPAVPGERSLVRHPGGEATAKQLVRDTPPPTGDAEEAYADDAESERKAIIDVDADDVADLSEEGISQDVTAAEGSAVQPFPVNASPPPRPKARKIPHNTPPAPATAPSLPHQSRPKKSMMDSLTAPIKRMTLPQAMMSSFVSFIRRERNLVKKREFSGAQQKAANMPLASPSLRPQEALNDDAAVAALLSRLKGKMFIMSKVSFIGLIFGLILISCLFFAAGFMTALTMNPAGDMAGLDDLEKSMAAAESPQEQKGMLQETIEKVMPSAAPAKPTKQQSQTSPVTSAAEVQQFSIRIDDYADVNEAKLKAIELEKKGYGSYIVRLPDPNGKTYTHSVRLGVFGDYLDANNFSRTLQSQGYTSAKVALISQGEDRFAP